jgi:hypothetical protein
MEVLVAYTFLEEWRKITNSVIVHVTRLVLPDSIYRTAMFQPLVRCGQSNSCTKSLHSAVLLLLPVGSLNKQQPAAEGVNVCHT